jgi:ribonuclease HII
LLVAGIDEAGRGCVIGPLVVAGVLMKGENLPALRRLGVKDSKLLSPKKREALYSEINKIAERSLTLKLSPAEIDQVVESQRKLHKLNRLEAQTMAKIIESFKPDAVYVDAADVVEDRFKNHIQEEISFKANIISEHKADRTYPIVSAASIIAKVERDRIVKSLSLDFGDFGSGYLADPKTTDFLRHWVESHDDYPPFVRQSWKPAKKVKNEKGSVQKRLA